MTNRRRFLASALAASAAAALPGCSKSSPWERAGYRKPERSRVAVLPARDYAAPLADILIGGLRLFSLPVGGKRVVLKPNLVEFDPRGVINTNPALVAAAIEAFRRLGAREVVVAEGAGHRRDAEYLLTASGLHAILRERRVPWVDLNHDETRRLALGSHYTTLGELHLPETIVGADLVVSMPKLKTHHWAGVTLSLKNMFGVIPGSLYGWPKNVLHWAGIRESILDINSTLPGRPFAIVDGIVGMEGNGPIQGEPKAAGVIVLGDDPVAVDATAARLMHIDPGKVAYLAEADRFLGNVARERIDQVGEPPERFQQEFRLIEAHAALRGLDG